MSRFHSDITVKARPTRGLPAGTEAVGLAAPLRGHFTLTHSLTCPAVEDTSAPRRANGFRGISSLAALSPVFHDRCSLPFRSPLIPRLPAGKEKRLVEGGKSNG